MLLVNTNYIGGLSHLGKAKQDIAMERNVVYGINTSTQEYDNTEMKKNAVYGMTTEQVYENPLPKWEQNE